MSKRIAIFASGAGSNAQRIIEYFQEKGGAEVVLLLCNKEEAPVLEKAQGLGVDQFVFNRKTLISEEGVLKQLQAYQIDLIVLAGFLWKVPEHLVAAFPNQIINVHPALLPLFGGKGMYGMHVHRAVVEAGVKESGISIHYVNEAYDEGALIFQAKCEVLATDTAEDVAQKIHQLEQKHFPIIIEQLLNN